MMFKMAGAVVDFYDDPEFYESTQAQNLIKTGMVTPVEDLESLRDKDFAVKIITKVAAHRKFPVNSPVATALSSRYFEEIESRLPEEIRKVAGYFLRRAHEEYGLDLTPSLMEPFDPAPHNEVELDQEMVPPLHASADGVAKLAQHGFMKTARWMPPVEKVARAREVAQILEKVGELVTEQEIWDYVPKRDSGPFAEEMLRQRITLAKEAGQTTRAALKGILKEASQMSIFEAPFLIHQFDKTAGLDYRYGMDGILDPFYGFWGGFPLPKEAGVKEDLLKYKLETIAIYDEMLKSTFGEPFVTKFTQDPKGTYEQADAAHKKVLDFLMEHVPKKRSEDQADDPKKTHALIESKTEDLEKEQVKPSEDPKKMSPFNYQSLMGALDGGL